MIYTGLNRTGEIETVKAHGGYDVAEVYGGIGESNPIYYKQREIAGTSPMQFKELGLPLKDYLISGNTVQNGTPAPDAPVDVVGCGVRTRNLYNDTATVTIRELGVRYGMQFPSGTYSIRNDSENTVYLYTNDGRTRLEVCAPHSENTVTFINYDIPCGFFMPYNSASLGGVTIVYESTPPDHYEPYGFKLPPTVNNTEYPIYLGQVPTTRRIKKVVLTGEEVDWRVTGTGRIALVVSELPLNEVVCVCSHYKGVFKQLYGDLNNGECTMERSRSEWAVYDSNYTTVDSFKAYLASQYAAGTPVVVWYVLAEPTTGIVNEPLHKIGCYADTVSMAQASVTIPTIAGTNTLLVDTTVQPSEVSITGNIKEVST